MTTVTTPAELIASAPSQELFALTLLDVTDLVKRNRFKSGRELKHLTVRVNRAVIAFDEHGESEAWKAAGADVLSDGLGFGAVFAAGRTGLLNWCRDEYPDDVQLVERWLTKPTPYQVWRLVEESTKVEFRRRAEAYLDEAPQPAGTAADD